MPPYGNEPESSGRRRDLTAAGIVLLLAFSSMYLSDLSQQRVAASLQVSVLRPFIAAQERLTAQQVRGVQVDVLTAQLDSVSAVLSTHAALLDENRTLRDLLALSERAGPSYLPANVLRPGTPGSESMFLVDVGSDDGIRQGSPVLSPRGLVGVIREVRRRSAVGMDWSHPDFRASAMFVDGSTYGMVENRPGRFREEDRLILNGVAFNQVVRPGMAVVTSGLGGLLPRGIPIGIVDSIADAQGTWLKSYWLEAAVELGAATHVLVLTDGNGVDVTDIWNEATRR